MPGLLEMPRRFESGGSHKESAERRELPPWITESPVIEEILGAYAIPLAEILEENERAYGKRIAEMGYESVEAYTVREWNPEWAKDPWKIPPPEIPGTRIIYRVKPFGTEYTCVLDPLFYAQGKPLHEDVQKRMKNGEGLERLKREREDQEVLERAAGVLARATRLNDRVLRILCGDGRAIALQKESVPGYIRGLTEDGHLVVKKEWVRRTR